MCSALELSDDRPPLPFGVVPATTSYLLIVGVGTKTPWGRLNTTLLPHHTFDCQPVRNVKTPRL